MNRPALRGACPDPPPRGKVFSLASLTTLAALAALVAFHPHAETMVLADRPPRPRSPSPEAGRSFTFSLPSAAFPDPAREEGYDLDEAFYDREAHYSDSSVTVYVPPGWEPANRVDLVFFFHGWMSSREEAIAEFKLFDQFAGSGIKALLVVPETAVHAPDSFGGKFEAQGGFGHFVSDLMETLDENDIVAGARAASIVLAGHSGAYRVIASIIRRGGLETHIREVWLFDALYAREGAFADWIARRHGRFICVSSRDSDTVDKAASLAGLLRERGIDYAAAEDAGEEWATLESPVVFLTSASDHFGVVSDHDEFRIFLSTSPLFAAAVDRPDFAIHGLEAQAQAQATEARRLAEGTSYDSTSGRQ
ncbi:MAG TPA: hypothetical protein VMV44_07545 [Rectinemataceae bacterium]|nr:hypothetical protein [Rectinemataceae bacterium]